MKPVALAWSGGKDSLMALEALEADPRVEVRVLLTTVTDPQRRISMHGIRESLLDAQAAALGLRLAKCRLPAAASNAVYRERFAAALRPLMDEGIGAVAFGDLFLEDVREFREEQMRALGTEALFPIWGEPTAAMACGFVSRGHRAVLCCIDASQIDPGFLGREFDASLLNELPAGADPCGENGEFHTFVHAGPRFASPLDVRRGETHVADGRFHFLDLS